MVSKYRTGGWFKEPRRHGLAAKGIKTGRKTNYSSPADLGIMQAKKDAQRFKELKARLKTVRRHQTELSKLGYKQELEGAYREEREILNKLKSMGVKFSKKSSKLTDEDLQKIDEMYNYEIPKYLKIVNKNKIQIRAEQWEGAGHKWIDITPQDVIKYYHGPARNITSGIRTLSTFSTDWRMVDNMAKESLEIFKRINREALEKEGKKYGMELKG